VQQRRRGPRLAQQPLDLAAVGSQLAVHHLHHHLRRRVDELGEVGVGHVAAAEELLQVELASEGGVEPILRVEIRR
jgi:hypothetical protein